MESDPFAVFRPRRGRAVALTCAGMALVIFGVGAVIMPKADWQVLDRVFFAAIGGAIAALFWRYGAIRAVPTREGLAVRNLLVTRTLAWPQVVRVGFGDAPWVHLDLDDGDTLAVMAVQRSDGEFARQEASRLAALVQALGTATDVSYGGPE